VVSFTAQPLHPQGKRPCGPQSRSGRVGEDKFNVESFWQNLSVEENLDE